MRLDAWLREPMAPASPAALTVGRAADLVVLDDGWDRIARSPAVAATMVGGAVVAGALPS